MNDYQELFSSESKRSKLAVFITDQIAVSLILIKHLTYCVELQV